MSQDTEDKKTAAPRTPAKKAASKKAPAKKAAAKKPATTKKTTAAAKKVAAKTKAPRKKAPAKKAPKEVIVPNDESKPEEPTMNSENTADDASFEEAVKPEEPKENANSWQDNKLFEEMKQRDWSAIAKRGLFMFVYALVGLAAMYVAVTLVAVQFVLSIVTGAPNDQVREWIVKLSEYMVTILKFLAYQTDDLPWPLDPTASSDSE